jgi:hypothetical protein
VTTTPDTAEHRRLAEATGRAEDGLFDANPWYEWGPYLAERAWGTVREDYSADGNAWASFPHDHARSRAYRWNEDGMAGISDVRHELCMALGLWNGVDPIIKERMFGLTGPEGNHGEDVKECWWYLEGLPSHALLRWRYHYPQAPFPYADLVAENGRRGKLQPEYELIDTGVFDDGRFWIVEVTYVKVSPTEILCQVDIENHGPDEATLHVLPTLWFHNTWRWSGSADVPALRLDGDAVTVHHPRLDGYRLEAAPGPDGVAPAALFCDNETNTARLYGGEPLTAYPKDGINDHLVGGAPTVNPDATGTKAAWWYRSTVPGGGRAQLRLRLHRPEPAGGGAAAGAPAPATATAPGPAAPAPQARSWSGASFLETVERRQCDADEFYGALAGGRLDEERMRILRQASAGLVWSKQFYPYRVGQWLDGDPAQPAPPPGHATGRNAGWRHLDAFDILAMPDPWEYPWFAAWDLAFHAAAWAHLDPAFAKYQLIVLLREWFLHPNGALPAYEWNFDDVNPPVHAAAAIRVFLIDGGTDTDFLERVFQKLLLNFTWWLNRQDPDGNNIFGGGFLGLDNISPIDRSSLPPGMRLEQADGTAWMAFYALGMLGIARTLAEVRPVYEDMVVKFAEQYLMIIDAMERTGLHDHEDGWFYDRLEGPEGATPIRVQTLVGAIPLLPTAVLRAGDAATARRLRHRFDRITSQAGGARSRHVHRSADGATVALTVVAPDELRRTLASLFDENAFLSPHGLRSLSKRHEVPYEVPGHPEARIEYEPGEGRTDMYGGNSNWRGPIWMPLNVMIISALVRYHHFLGDEYTVEYPTGSGRLRTLADIAGDLGDRLVSIWLPGPDGRRPVNGDVELLQSDPAWQGLLWFPEYFHGDTGAGLGAMHQTGWTAEVVNLLLAPPRDTWPG